MTTPLFIETGGRSKLEDLLLQVSGDSEGHRAITYTEELKTAVLASKPGIWNPKTLNGVKESMKFRSLAIWDRQYKYAFVPGPACFGRIVTLHTCWVPPGHENPKSESEFRLMPGYAVSVCGGTGDPQFNRGWTDIPFSTSRHKVIFSNTLGIQDPMKLAWWYEVTDVSEVKGSGAHFFLRIEGEYEVFGSFV